MSTDAKIKWFWAHRRTASLHHFSFLMHGLRNSGWSPVVNFRFDNQIVVGVPKKGSYVFYDKDQLAPGAKFKDIQDSIDSNPQFVTDFRRRTDEIFREIFLVCDQIEAAQLSSLEEKELSRLYEAFLSAVMVAPFITVQPWGIEACFDDEYKIMSFLRARLQELGKVQDLELYKSLLSINTGETVAYTERKHFYEVCVELVKNKVGFENSELIDNHIKNYYWVNTEYVGDGWTREKWVALFRNALDAEVTPAEKLQELLESFKKLNADRQKAIEELNPPQDVVYAISALAEFIAQRDWVKGYFTKALLSYHKLLDEIAGRIGVTRGDLFYYSYLELGEYFKNKTIISTGEIENRKANGFVILIKGGQFNLITGKEHIELTIKEEGISEPFDRVINITEFKGLPASLGHITARARVLEDASRISELQEGEILITYMTTIEFIPAFRKAAAVITDEGGMSCHAAIISREFKLPCIVGTKVATRAVQTGDLIEVDAAKGIVKILETK